MSVAPVPAEREPSVDDSIRVPSFGRRGRTWSMHVVAILAAAGLALTGFIYSFNQLGGTLGGFKNDEFATLVHTNMILSGLQPLRDFEEAGLRAAWPSLTFELPALVERLWGRNLFVHACLTLGALALCRFVVFLLARNLSRGWVIAALAPVLVFVSMPEPYNYPKLLVLTIAGLLITWTMKKPDVVRLGVLAMWTVISILFRHDFGVYVIAGTVAALIALEPKPWGVPARRLATYAAIVALLSIPSFLWIHDHRGVIRYMSEAKDSSYAEYETRRLKEWPVIHIGALSARDSIVSLCYYAFWTVPAITIIALAGLSRHRKSVSPQLAVGWGLAAMTLAVNYFFLRSNVQARFGDAAVPVALVAAWTAGAASSFPTPGTRRLARIAPAVLLLLLCAAFIRINFIPPPGFESTGFAQSFDATRRRFREVKQELQSLPPVRWTDPPKTGNMAVARYLNECMKPDDYVLVGMYGDDIVAFSRRRYAGGQAYFDGSFFQSDAAQSRALRRLSVQSVPVAITTTNYQDEFVSDFPLVARYLFERYRQVGTIAGDEDRPGVRVWVEAARPPTGVDRVLGFPCFR